MSKRRDVVSPKHRKWYFPSTGTVAWWLLADRIGLPGWGWGVFWTIVAIVWVALLTSFFYWDEVERTPVWDDSETAP